MAAVLKFSGGPANPGESLSDNEPSDNEPSPAASASESNTEVVEQRLEPGASAAAARPRSPQPNLVDQPAAVATALVERLRLATWNLSWLGANNGKGRVKRNDADFARLSRYARELDADVVAFQEVASRAAAERVFDPAVYDIHISSRRSPQRTGFAYKRHLAVTPHPDYVALDVGGVRYGSDVSIDLGNGDLGDGDLGKSGPRGGELRLLSVHLKSGCFERELTSRSKACSKLTRQLPYLEAWIDARAADGVKFAVLGDFNRRLFKTDNDEFWSELDDADPPEADLASPTEGQRSACWNGKYPDFIDHLVLSKSLNQRLASGSFTEHVYDGADASHRRVLSDHCPLSARFEF